MEHKTEYKEWLPRQGMSEESAVRYVRGISSILNLLKEQERIGVCDSGRDAVRLLDAYDAVTKDQKYFKKYMHYLCDGREVSAAALFVALKQLRAVFHRSEKGERDELLGAIHPNFESFLSSADRARLRNGASDGETRAQAYLLRLALAEETVIGRLEELLYKWAKEFFENSYEYEVTQAEELLCLLLEDAAASWHSEALRWPRECAAYLKPRELRLFCARQVRDALLLTLGVSAPQAELDLPVRQALEYIRYLSREGGVSLAALQSDTVRKLLQSGALELCDVEDKGRLAVRGKAVIVDESLLWKDPEARKVLCRLMKYTDGPADVTAAVGLLALAPKDAAENPEPESLYTVLLQLICRNSLDLRACENVATRLEGCEHLEELFRLCPYTVLQMLEKILPPEEQYQLFQRDGSGNTLCFARLLEDMANCAKELAKGDGQSYYLTYAATCFGRASAIAEGCGAKEVALRCANGRRDVLQKIACEAVKNGVVDVEYHYDHALPIIAETERIARLEQKRSVQDVRELRLRYGEMIVSKECPTYLNASPLILKPHGVDLGGFYNEYYIASLDSELARRKKPAAAEVQSVIMMKLLQGHRVILSANQLVDNPRVLELADEPAFLELIRRGYILLSLYGQYYSLSELCAAQMEGRFEWSSMPDLNYIDNVPDAAIAAKRQAAADLLRGKKPDALVLNSRERQVIILFKERLTRFEEAFSLAGLCYYYQRNNAPITGVLRPELDRYYRQHITDPELAVAKEVHGIIDRRLLRLLQEGGIADYNRSAYKNCIDLIEAKVLSDFALSAEERAMLEQMPSKHLEQLRDVLSDQHNYLLSGRISNYYHNDFKEQWRLPGEERGAAIYKNVLLLRLSGERMDWRCILEQVTRMRSLIRERPTPEQLESMLSEGRQRFIFDGWNRLRVQRVGLVFTDGREGELMLSETEDATIHVEMERGYER